MQDFPTFLMNRGLTLPDYHKLSPEKQQYLRETWQIETGSTRTKRYGIDEGRSQLQRTNAASQSSSFSWVWLMIALAGIVAGLWLVVSIFQGPKPQIQAGSQTTSNSTSGSVQR